MGIKDISRKHLIIGLSLSMIGLYGCGGEKKAESPKNDAAVSAPAAVPGANEKGAMPEGHPPVGDKVAENLTKASHSAIKTQKEVRIPDEVKAKWKEIKMEITDASSRRKEVVTLKVGGTVTLRDTFKLKVEAFVPDYAIAENTIQTRSNEPRNPAALVELLDGDKSVARGWIFKEFPDFNSYTDDRFALVLVAPSVEKAAAPGHAAKK